MIKILVPTDFSDTARNAARFAVDLAANDPGVTIVLYHVYDSLAAGSDGSLLTETEEDRKKVLNMALSNLEIELHETSPVRIQHAAEEGRSLVENVEQYVRNNGINFVVMGITGASRIEQILMSSNTLDMANGGVCPVIIVPPDARFKKVENVLLASDFKDVETTTPVSQIRQVLNIFKPGLHIVNVDSENSVELTEEYQKEKAWLKKTFEDYHPEFHFVRMSDFAEAISSFAADHNIDLIITVPRKHSFLQGLYKSSHTKRLAYHSHIPVVAIHE